MKTLLVLGEGCDDLLAGLRGVHIVRAATLGAAESALRHGAVACALACQATPAAEVEGLVAAIGRVRPGVPVLALRNRQHAESARWAKLGIGVLRFPLLPEAVARSVEVVLGLKK